MTKEKDLLLPVELQLEAYNQKNVIQFISFYSVSTTIVMRGESKDYDQNELGNFYGNFFKKYPNVFATVCERLVNLEMQTVTDKEHVNYGTPERTPGIFKVTYTVENKKIKKVEMEIFK